MHKYILKLLLIIVDQLALNICIWSASHMHRVQEKLLHKVIQIWTIYVLIKIRMLSAEEELHVYLRCKTCDNGLVFIL